MASNPKTDLLSLLPAGEWRNVRILNRPPGMMASREWGLFAKAQWLRDGGKNAFIKFIIPAPSSAGATTAMVTSKARLRELEKRLRRLKELGKTIPLVPLLSLQLAECGLMIAMLEVQPLQDAIEGGEAYNLSERVLTDLDPETEGVTEWLHYDICPRNIGITSDRRCVLIDVESFYIKSTDRFEVSVPAWKRFRLPVTLAEEVDERQVVGEMFSEIAVRKVRFEVALAAAECVLGPMPSGAGGQLDSSRLETWLLNADANDPAVAFWARILRIALRDGSMPSLRILAEELRGILRSHPRSAQAPLVPDVLSVGIAPPDPADPIRAALEPVEEHSQWRLEWGLLKPSAHALRAGKLDAEGLLRYKEALEILGIKYPKQRQVWEELLLVTISYQRDSAAAQQIAEMAITQLPSDRDFLRYQRMVRAWNTEQKR